MAPMSSVTRLALVAAVLIVTMCIGMFMAPGAAHAQSCSATVGDAAFAAVDPLGTTAQATTATLTFTCQNLVPAIPVTLCANLDAGSGGADGMGGRLVSAGGGHTMSFQLWQDSNHSVPWGSISNTSLGTVPAITATPGLSGKITVTRTLYATVSGSGGTVPGSYTSAFANEQFLWGLNLLGCSGVTVGTTITPATFTFTAPVSADCSVQTSPLAFGNVGLLTSAAAAQNEIDVTCTSTTTYSVGLDHGQTGTGPTSRLMVFGGGHVTYGIYKDLSHTQPWGNLADGLSYVQSGVGTGASGAQPFYGYGLAPVQATPRPGGYSDNIVVTVTY